MLDQIAFSCLTMTLCYAMLLTFVHVQTLTLCYAVFALRDFFGKENQMCHSLSCMLLDTDPMLYHAVHMCTYYSYVA